VQDSVHLRSVPASPSLFTFQKLTRIVFSSFSIVPRPLFVEEFGLKRLMAQRGVSLELARTDFEAGRWEVHIEEAYELGREAKEEARRNGFVDEGAAEFIRKEIEEFMGSQPKREVEERKEEKKGMGCVGM